MLCFHIRLVKAWEPNVAVIRLKLSVDIFTIVARVFVVLKSFTISDV